jgi:hypothetical protein
MATFQGDTIVGTFNLTRNDTTGDFSHTVTSGRFAVIEISQLDVATFGLGSLSLSVAGISIPLLSSTFYAGVKGADVKPPIRFIIQSGQTFAITTTLSPNYTAIVNIFEYNNP